MSPASAKSATSEPVCGMVARTVLNAVVAVMRPVAEVCTSATACSTEIWPEPEPILASAALAFVGGLCGIVCSLQVTRVVGVRSPVIGREAVLVTQRQCQRPDKVFHVLDGILRVGDGRLAAGVVQHSRGVGEPRERAKFACKSVAQLAEAGAARYHRELGFMADLHLRIADIGE